MTMTTTSATELASALQKGEITSVECTTAFLDRIGSTNPTINAFLSVDRDGALAKAEAVDTARAQGKPLGPLAGLPVAVKDVLCTTDQKTTCASRMLKTYEPPYDADVVRRLREADAIILGKTNMDEFAMGGSNENSAYGLVRNPWDTNSAPGGSSGGSAAAVAADMAPLAIGSDTGGSIRQPAGLCGITGLKPTYGRVSRRGLIAFSSSLDQIGPMARSAKECAMLLQAIAGHDPGDSTSLNTPVPDYLTGLEKPLQGLRIGRVAEHFGEGLDQEVAEHVEQTFAAYEAAGATIHEVELPHARYGVPTYYLIAPSEASSNLARYDGAHYGHRWDGTPTDDQGISTFDSPLVEMYCRSRAEGFGPEVKRRIMLGTYALSAGYYDAYYAKALRVRRLIRNDFTQAFKKVDLIGGPVSATPAFKLGEKTDDPVAMYLVDLYTVGANLAGIGGISFPCGFTKTNLPVGFQLQGPALSEPLLLQAAHQYQQTTDWHLQRTTAIPS
ncbi:MAG: Asp-tRNA(Asn)/Glu-tRNA(Gln) amidotransferase subunit GatA [Pirellulales bacterium]|nr:Asp-tRNA(Asn)/Glu-tRNA(Gln) amidotransferase subunit GatA [Pirellulales bacterium]